MKIRMSIATEEDSEKIDVIKVMGYTPCGKPIRKADGSHDFIEVGIRAYESIRWGEFKELSNNYYGVDVDEEKKKGKPKLRIDKGDTEKILRLVKWYKDEDGQRDFTEAELIGLSTMMIAQIEEHLPDREELLSNWKNRSAKKKSRRSSNRGK